MRSLIFLLLFSSQAFGALSIRDLDGDWSNGHEGVYDDVLDITWLADANYLNTVGFDVNARYANTASAYDYDGRVPWSAAKVWAEDLTVGFYDNWRLPSIYGHVLGELGHMYFNNLGNNQNSGVENNTQFIDSISGQTNSFLNVQAFSNPQSYTYNDGYWLQEESPLGSYTAWKIRFSDGYQALRHKGTSEFMWPVHDGDIGASAVPLPAGIYLFLSGLVGLGLMRGRNG